MKNIKLSAALLALAGVAVFGTAAKAQTPLGTTTFSDGDMILGVYDTTNTVTSSYEVNLGNITQFETTKVPIVFTLTPDLTSLFTSKGVADDDLTYSVQGYTAASDDIYITNQEDTPGTSEAPIFIGFKSTNGATSSFVTNISAFENGLVASGTYKGETAHGTTYADATFISNTLSQSFEPTVNGHNGDFGLANDVPTSVLNVLGDGVSDLDEIVPGGQTSILGTFTFGDDGILTFDPEGFIGSVPEPSTYALFLCGGVLLFLAIKRRNARA